MKKMKFQCSIIATLLFTSLAPVQAADTPVRKPNILHIHADDHRPDGIGALGNKELKTPNLDQIVKRGMVFSQCYTQGSMVGAVCLPSRTMMLTGRSWLRIEKQARPKEPTIAGDSTTYLPKVIASAGYETWHLGKGGNDFKAGIAAFNTNLIDEGKGEDRRGSSRRHADATIKFLKERPSEKPFYIYLAPPVPHDPRIAEPEFMKMYKAENITLSPAFMPLHPWDNGEMTVRDEKLAPWPRTIENTKQQLADYYSCITGFDHHIGRIFAQLKDSGQLDNTIIVFTGDNGLSMGDHGLFGKQNLYEFGGMHVPLIIAGPGITQGKSTALVYLMDLFPTFCEFAGAKIPTTVESKSLLPIIQGKEIKVREVLYTAYRDCQRAIRDDRWKLIRYPLVDKTQLFDLTTDKYELINLAEKPEYGAKIKEMTALLEKEMTKYGDKALLKVENPKSPEWKPPANNAKKTKKQNVNLTDQK